MPNLSLEPLFNEKRNHHATAQTQKQTYTIKKQKIHVDKKERQKEKGRLFSYLVINIDQYLNEALTLLIHTIT